MRVLVSGATGLIGRQLVQLLQKRGHQPVVLSHSAESAQRRFPDLQVFPWDPLSRNAAPLQFGDVDGIVNLAGASIADGRWTRKRKEIIRTSRTRGTEQLIGAINGLSPRQRVFVCGSAVGYYGSRGDDILDESAPPGNDFLARVSADVETTARQGTTSCTRVVLLRTGVVLSAEGGALAKMLPLFQMGLGGPLGAGNQWFSWIHERDISALIVFALENKSVEGPLNAVAPQPVTNREFTIVLSRLLGRRPFPAMPAAALRLLAGELSGALLGSQRSDASLAISKGFAFEFSDIEKALSTCLEQNNIRSAQ